MDFITAEDYATVFAFVAALAAGVMLILETKARWPYCLAAALFGAGIGAYFGIHAIVTGRVAHLPLWVLQTDLVKTWSFTPDKVMRPEDFEDCVDYRAGGITREIGRLTICPEDFH
ncbi:MAG: hypothetical protein WBX25_29835 [Rhodomicrobium sp.]